MMKKIFLITLTAILMACGTQQTVTTFGGHMKNVYEKQFTQAQFDSICTTDKLPTDLTKWHKNTYNDFETGEIINDISLFKN